MAKLLVIGLVFFLIALAALLTSVLCADKLDSLFTTMRRDELHARHKTIVVRTLSTIASGALLSRSDLAEEVVDDANIPADAIRSVREASQWRAAHEITPHTLLTRQELEPITPTPLNPP